MKLNYLLIVLLFLAVSCSSYKPPKKYDFEKERIYNVDYDTMWQRVVNMTSDMNMPIKNIDKNSGLIASDYNLSTSTMSNIMDCGTPAESLDIYKFEDPRANLNIVVSKVSGNKTKVKVNLFCKTFYSRYSYVNGQYYKAGSQMIDCNSTGKLETEILNYLGQ